MWTKGADENFPRLPADGHVEQDLLVDAVVVVQVVRAPLVEPARLARVGVAREDARRPLVVARPLRGVPGAGVACAVEDEVLFRVVGDPAPDRPAAYLPGVGRPRRDSQILPLILRVEGLEVGADQTLGIRPRAVGPPGDFAARGVERGEPAAYPHLAARVADQHLALDDERGHRHRFALVDVPQRSLPDFLAR